MKVEKIDHITIRVKDMKKATEFFADLLGTEFKPLGDFTEQGIRMSIDPLGIGIAESLTPDGALAKTIEKRGEGLSTLSVKVANLEEAVNEMKSRGIRQIGSQEHSDFRAAMFHPADTYGTMIELIEYKA